MAYTLQTPTRPPLDALWFSELNNLASGLNEIYTVLGPSARALAQLRSRFEASGRVDSPRLRPESIDASAYLVRAEALTRLRNRIEQEEVHDAVRTAYSNHISELLEHINLLVAAQRQDDDAFYQANVTIYGAPDVTMFEGVYAWLFDFIAIQTKHPDRAVQRAAEAVAKTLRTPTPDAPAIVPDQATFTAVRRLHYSQGGYFDRLFAGTPELPEGVIRQSSGDPVAWQVLSNIGSDYALVDADDHLWGVVHGRHAVVRPRNYVLDREAFYGLLAHELGSHLLERVNGLRQPLRLLGLGLDRYDHCNEGRAFLREQIRYKTADAMSGDWEWQSHILLHYAIGLAEGLHEGHRYSFADVYNTLLPICLVWELLRIQDRPKAEHNAATFAWNVTARCLKGTDGAGGAYLKDTIYLEGNMRCWQAAAKDPNIVLVGDMGKFDISRSDHWDILRALEIV